MSFEVFQRMWTNTPFTDFLYHSLEEHLNCPIDLASIQLITSHTFYTQKVFIISDRDRLNIKIRFLGE